MKIGAAIKQLRTAAGLNQGTVAKMAMITGSYLAQIESGKRNVTHATLQNIADGLNISIAAIYVTAIEIGDIQSNDPTDKYVLLALETGKKLILESL